MLRLPRFFALAVLAGLLGVFAAKAWKSATGSRPIAATPAAISYREPVSPSSLPSAHSPAPQLAEPQLSLSGQIARALRGGTEAERNRAYHELLPRLIAQDPRRAARLAVDEESGEPRAELMREVARQWAERDLAAALTWLAELNDADRAGAIEAAINQVARTDAAGALEIAQTFQVGLHDGTLEHRLQLWTEQAPADAVAWVQSRPAGPARDRLLARAAYVRVQTDPPAAMELLSLMSSDPASEAPTRAVLQLWQRRDPAAATAWLTQNGR
jgi:hypothetical protein